MNNEHGYTSVRGVFGDRFSILIDHAFSVAVVCSYKQHTAYLLTGCLYLTYGLVWSERGRGSREKERERVRGREGESVYRQIRVGSTKVWRRAICCCMSGEKDGEGKRGEIFTEDRG